MSVSLLILRHAKSSWKNIDINAHERPLSNRGYKNATAMSNYLSKQSIKPNLIVCSTAKRAKLTLKPIKNIWPDIAIKYEQCLYFGSEEEIISLIKSLEPNKIPLIIGHNPVLEILIHLFTIPEELNKDSFQELKYKFPTGSLVYLDFNSNKWTDIERHSAIIRKFVKSRELRN